MREALYFSPHNKDKKSVRCFLCPNACIIPDGSFGACRLRKNEGGILYAMGYGKIISCSLDPVEKKPLYHYYPGSQIFSIGLTGCNFRCSFCQNSDISQAEYNEDNLREGSSSDLVRLAKEYASLGIAYTYNEPLINYEFILDTAVEARKQGLKNVLVSNGHIEEAPLLNLIEYIDAANIDVKSFRQHFYAEYCRGRMDAVLRTCEILVRKKKHLEITSLIIPGLNDSEDEISDLTDWIYSLSEYVPLHFSRYFPKYKMTVKPTPYSTLEKARLLAQKKLKYVYIGNVFEETASNTYCPSCLEPVIERKGYNVKISGLKETVCAKCGNEVPGLIR